MKKLTLVITIISIAVVASAAVVYFNFAAKPPAIETILPADAVLFVKFSDVDRQVKEFKASKLYKNLGKIDIEMLMGKSGANKEDIEKFRTTKTELTSFISGLLLDKYFGREIAVAVYPVKRVEFTPEAGLEMASNVTLVTRVKPETKFIDLLSKIFNKAGRKFDVSEETYKGRKITVVKLDDKVSLAYVKIKDMLVIGVGKKAATSCCDVADRKLLPLSEDKEYVSAMSKFPKGADVTAFGDIEQALSGLRKLMSAVQIPADKSAGNGMPDPGAMFQEQMSRSLDLYAGFKTVGYAKYPGKIVKERFIVGIDRSKLAPYFKGLYSIKARKNTALKLAPASTIYYDWGTFDFKGYWKFLKDEMSKNPNTAAPGMNFNDLVAGFEQQTGMNMDNEIVPALGDETGFILTDINLDGMIPMPHFVIFVKADNKQAIDKLIGAFTGGGKVNVESETYNGTKIQYIALPFGLAFQPAFCYVGDYFLVSLGRETVKQSVDSYSGAAKSLFESEEFKAVNNGLTDPANRVCFVKVDVLLQKAKGVCDWLVRWMAFMSEQQKKYKDIMKAQVETMETEAKSLEKEVADLRAKRLDPAVTPEAASELDSQIEEKESTLSMDKEQIEQYKEMDKQGSGAKKDFDAATARLWLDNAVYPVIEGLQSLRAVGSKAIFTDNAIEMESFSKITE